MDTVETEKKINKRYLLTFLLITFGISWTIIIAYIIFNDAFVNAFGELTLFNPVVMFVLYSPTIAGLIVTYRYDGFEGIKKLLLKLKPRKKDLFWFPIIFVVGLIFYASMHYGSIILGIPVPKSGFSFGDILVEASKNLFEETGLIGGAFGWIGFMLPYLQKKFNGNAVPAFLTGIAFGLYVMPGYVISSFETATLYPLYVTQIIIFIYFFSFLFNATNGNTLFYIYTFWLMATGSRLKFYYFQAPVQLLQIAFFTVLSFIMYMLVKNNIIEQKLQVFPEYLE